MGSFYMEATQINYRRDESLKTVDQKLQELSETSAIDTDIAPVFKSTNTYAPGDMVYYRNKLYVFNVEHTGTWAAGDVSATDVTTEISSLKSGLTNYENQNNLNLEVPNRKNIAAGVVSFETTIQFATALYVDYNLKPSTTYTLSFDGTEGNQLYANENIFVQDTTITIGSSRTSVTVTTKSTIPSSEYTEGRGWRFLKNKITEPNDNTFTDVQLEYGSTATAYTPYIPSVESRIEAVESGLTNVQTVSTFTTDADVASAFYGKHNYHKTILMKDITKTMALLASTNRENLFVTLTESSGMWGNHPNYMACVNNDVFVGVLNIGSNSVSVTTCVKLAEES